MNRSAFPVLIGLLGLAFGAPLKAGPDAPVPKARIASTQSWPDERGRLHAPLASQGERATVLLFLMHDCPVTNSVAPELNRLSEEFRARGIRFFRVYSTETAEELDQHTRDFGFKCPGLRDPAMELAHLTGATRAPEAVVIGTTGEILYRGRVDDRAMKAGILRPKATRRDLHLALQAVLAGGQPAPRFSPAVGCYLPVNDSTRRALSTSSK